MEFDKKKHWEKVYETKSPNEVSWTQEIPKTSLEFISSIPFDKKTSIIDIGGGDSKLVDFLLEKGFEDITVLDISEKSLEKAKKRLGNKADKVNWIVSDILEFKPERTYSIWHDRAVFHFITEDKDVANYIEKVTTAAEKLLVIGTFSEDGPLKCSGLEIKQYNENSLTALFQNNFIKKDCKYENHVTPFNTEQNFLFCSFKKR
ncbi:class I SAM-dependent methyltransferase [Tenacibaculum sp. MEBiC06402]|uniref:class I SAM-dependent methyltransferase n=1 Tax=unclassified Tenacibaculum TaxID=2635139 RepID=UPI003B9A83FF